MLVKCPECSGNVSDELWPTVCPGSPFQPSKQIKPHWNTQCGFTHVSHILFCCIICARFPPICSFLIPMGIKWYQTKMLKTTFLQGKRALPQEFEPPCFHWKTLDFPGLSENQGIFYALWCVRNCPHVFPHIPISYFGMKSCKSESCI